MKQRFGPARRNVAGFYPKERELRPGSAEPAGDLRSYCRRVVHTLGRLAPGPRCRATPVGLNSLEVWAANAHNDGDPVEGLNPSCQPAQENSQCLG